MNWHIAHSGGGSAGAYFRGIIRWLREAHPQTKFEGGCGVSVGALNLLPLMYNDFDAVEKFWDEVADHPEKVYRKKPLGYLNLIWSDSIYDSKPLLNMIKSYLASKKGQPITGTWRYGFVRLNDGEMRNVEQTYSALPQAILASASMPGFFPLVDITSDDRKCADGGLRDITPMKWILEDVPPPERVLIVQCSPGKVPYRPPDKLKKGTDVLLRSVTIMLDEIYQTDLDRFLLINEAVKQAEAKGNQFLKPNGTPYKYVEAVLLRQAVRYGDTLSFKKEDLEAMANNGYNDAKRLLP